MRIPDEQLLAQFVAAFTELDGPPYCHDSPPPDEFAAGVDPDDWNLIQWRPATVQTPQEALGVIHRGRRLPLLFEQLVLSYRWPAVDIGVCRMLANPPGSGLEPLASAMFGDPVLTEVLLGSGFVRFALAGNGSYDPICFDSPGYNDGDCPIVRLDHESVLTNGEVGKAERVFESFRDLIHAALGEAK